MNPRAARRRRREFFGFRAEGNDEKKKLDGNENARQSKQPKKSPKTRSNKIFQRAVSGLGVCWACLRVIVVVMWKC